MQFITFLLGVIIGLILPRVKYESEKAVDRIREWKVSREKTQFIEPINAKEEFKKSEQIDEFIDKLNG